MLKKWKFRAAAITLLTYPKAASSQNPADWQTVIGPATDVGIGVMKIIINSTQQNQRPPNALLSADTKKILIDLDKSFKRTETKALGTSFIASSAELTAATITLGLATVATGGAAVVIPAVGALTTMGIDQIGTAINDIAAEDVIHNLLNQRSEIERSLGLTLEDLVGNSMPDVQAKLSALDSFSEELVNLVPEDHRGRTKEMVAEITANALKNLSIESFRQISSNTRDISQVREDLGAYIKQNNDFNDALVDKLNIHETRLINLEEGISSLQSSMDEFSKTLEIQGKSLAIVSDFVFARMSPSEKVNALNNGIFSSRLSCDENNNGSDCATKEKLIDMYQKQAKVQELVTDAASFTKDITGLASLASNLGIKAPLLNDAANLASVATTAMTSYLSGDWIGAASAVSSLLVKRPDPDAERHKQLMGYLAKQFEVVNAKLDNIIRNQQQILEGIAQLSEQSARQFKALDERLANMEFEGKITSLAVRSLFRERWKDCNTVSTLALTSTQAYSFDKKKLDFTSLKGISDLESDVHNQIEGCFSQLLNQFTSLTKTGTFGNFLSLTFALDNMSASGVDLTSSNEVHSKSELQTYVTEVHNATLLMISQSPGFQTSDWPTLYAESAYPQLNLSLPRLAKQNVCAANEGVGDSIRGLICQGNKPIYSSNSESFALELLSEPADVTLAKDFTDWALLHSRIRDFYQGDQFFLDVESFLINAGRPSFRPQGGTLILLPLERILSYVMASRSIIYGRAAIDAAYDTLESTPASKNNVYGLLQRNTYLRHNLAVKVLTSNINLPNSAVLQPHTYQFSLGILLGDPQHDLTAFKSMFAEKPYYELKFNEEKNWPEVCFIQQENTSSDICTSLPTAESLYTHKIEFPEYIYKIADLRNQARQRIFEYDALDDMPRVQIEAIGHLFLTDGVK